jgi:hypothetical protein
MTFLKIILPYFAMLIMKKVLLFLLFFSLYSFISLAQKHCNLICNGNFEYPNVAPSVGLIPASQTGCWQTTAPDTLIELWSSGFFGVNSFSGNQHLELNAFYVSTVYQDFYVASYTPLEINFAHRGRAGIDTMSVSFGPQGGPYTTLGVFANGTSWNYHTINLVVPNAGYYSLRFNSIYATLGLQSVGNFLDSVTVCIVPTTIDEHFENIKAITCSNPFDKSLSLTIPAEHDEKISISLFSIQGQKILSKDYFLKAGSNNIEISTEDLPGSFYLLQLRTEKQSFFKKLVKN